MQVRSVNLMLINQLCRCERRSRVRGFLKSTIPHRSERRIFIQLFPRIERLSYMVEPRFGHFPSATSFGGVADCDGTRKTGEAPHWS